MLGGCVPKVFLFLLFLKNQSFKGLWFVARADKALKIHKVPIYTTFSSEHNHSLFRKHGGILALTRCN